MAQDPFRYFRIEARDLLDGLSEGILAFEKGPPPATLVPHLLRLAHTLKGAARVVKQLPIAEAAHAIEDILVRFRDTAQALPRDQVNSLLGFLDSMEERLSSLDAPPVPANPAPRPPPKEPFRTIRAESAELDALLAGVAETHAQLSIITRGSEALERARHLAELIAEQSTKASQRESAGDSGARKLRSMSEDLGRILARAAQDISVGVDYADRELGQVREAAERLRLLPASSIFGALERTARDVAHTLGKAIVFECSGADVRLDGQVLGAVQAALLQAVRNAVVHGVENGTERTSAGKPEAGTVSVQVARRGEVISFACADDGRGVDLEAVRRIGQRRGTLPAGTDVLGAGELLQLLLKGGISTSTAITEHAGRGVGLDVIREAVESLRGTVTVETVSGRGTKVELVVPVSLASLQVLVMEAAGVLAMLPLDAVASTLRVRPGDVTRSVHGGSIRFEGVEIPFLPLARLLGRASNGAGQACTAVIVHAASTRMALGVDKLRGTTSAMLRPLPRLAPSDPVVTGASLDAAGTPRLVLDARALIAAARGQGMAEPLPRIRPAPILIIDDSLTTRMLEQSILESAGFLVESAISGEEALDKARRTGYSLFLVDVEMPGMDGFEFIQRARTEPGLRDVPAFLVTSRDTPEDRQRGTAVGACAYIVKSEFDQAEFLDRIRELVGCP